VIPLDSKLEGYENSFGTINGLLQEENFSLGGGYTYEQGFFDRPLDPEAHIYRYYLRIPARALNGDLDHPKTKIRLGQPFIIKHEVLTGNDPSADIGLASALINQFTTPVNAEDHPIADHYIERGKQAVQQAEAKLLSS
jgi:hypothetical protein